MECFSGVGRTTVQLYFSCVIMHYSLVNASNVIRKQHFLRETPPSPLPKPLLVVSMEKAFQCTYSCAERMDCSFYSQDKPTKKCSLYVDQQGDPVVARATGTGDIFYKGDFMGIYIYTWYTHIGEWWWYSAQSCRISWTNCQDIAISHSVRIKSSHDLPTGEMWDAWDWFAGKNWKIFFFAKF